MVWCTDVTASGHGLREIGQLYMHIFGFKFFPNIEYVLSVANSH